MARSLVRLAEIQATLQEQSSVAAAEAGASHARLDVVAASLVLER